MINKINGYLQKPNSLKGATSILAVTLFLSNLLGLVRNIVLASNFKPEDLDIYYAGFQLPNLIFNLLVFGAITTAFIPVLSSLITEKKEERASQLTQQIFNLVTIIIIVLSLVISFLMPVLIQYIVPGFSEEKMGQAVVVSRIMFLQAIIFGWSYIIGGVLNVYKRFTAYALAPLFYNLAIISGALLGYRIGIVGLAWSVVIGAFLHLLIQLIPAWQVGFRFGWQFRLFPETKTIFRLMLPRNLSLGFQQVNLLVFTALASIMSGGAIAIFNLTNDFQTAPVVIFANSLAVALFPTLSELANQKKWIEFESVFNKSIRMTLFFLIPSCFIIFILRAQIMRLYVGLGKSFDWEATIMAINTLTYFLIGIVPSGILAIYSRVFYALKNTKLPMYFSAISILIAILSAKYFFDLGVAGLALASSIGSIFNALFLIISYQILYKKKLSEQKILKTIVASVIISAVMAIFIWLSLRLVDIFYHLEQIPTSTHEVVGLFFQTFISSILGVSIYWWFSLWWQKEEIKILLNFRNTKKNDKFSTESND